MSPGQLRTGLHLQNALSSDCAEHITDISSMNNHNNLKLGWLRSQKGKLSIREMHLPVQVQSSFSIFKFRVCAYSVSKSCLTLWDPMDCSPPDSSVHGILQQEYWTGLPFSSPGDLPRPRDWTHGSCVSCTFRQILYPSASLVQGTASKFRVICSC